MTSSLLGEPRRTELGEEKDVGWRRRSSATSRSWRGRGESTTVVHEEEDEGEEDG
jgi:hypothetical protein